MSDEYRVHFNCKPSTEAAIQTYSTQIMRPLHPTVSSAIETGEREAKAHRRVGCCDGAFEVLVRVVGEWEPVTLAEVAQLESGGVA